MTLAQSRKRVPDTGPHEGVSQGLSFWNALQDLVDGHDIETDRPKWSSHPRYPDFTYEFDYGYLMGTRSGDGEGIDVWLGSGDRKRITGVILTVDRDQLDVELKVLLGCSIDEAEEILDTHNRGSQSGMLLIRPWKQGS
jgi:inorganic pyrophosphatase